MTTRVFFPPSLFIWCRSNLLTEGGWGGGLCAGLCGALTRLVEPFFTSAEEGGEEGEKEEEEEEEEEVLSLCALNNSCGHAPRPPELRN